MRNGRRSGWRPRPPLPPRLQHQRRLPAIASGSRRLGFATCMWRGTLYTEKLAGIPAAGKCWLLPMMGDTSDIYAADHA